MTAEEFVKEHLRMRAEVSDFSMLNAEACLRYVEEDVGCLCEFQKQAQDSKVKTCQYAIPQYIPGSGGNGKHENICT